jgi:hypothetical protein
MNMPDIIEIASEPLLDAFLQPKFAQPTFPSPSIT